MAIHEVSLRKLVVADATAYRELRLQALEREPLAFGRDAEEYRATTMADAEDHIRALLAPSFLLGGFDGNALVATATFSRETGRKEKHKGHIRGVYVSHSHRGRGVGARLVASLLSLAREDPSLEQVLLGVGTENAAAIRTYRRLGFEIYGTEPRALKVGLDYVDEHQMILRIRPQ